MKLDWFTVGVKTWFMGFGPEVEITRIDERDNSWIGFDCDGYHKYPLDEVETHWKNVQNK